MTYHDMTNQCVEVQNEIIFCYYDYTNDKRVFIPLEEANDLEIKYIYTENDIIYIEVEVEL